MGMTMTQKILAAHAGLESVKAGQLIEAKLDLVLGNDVTTPVAIKDLIRLVLIRFLIRIRWLSFWITLPPTRTSRRQSSARPAVPLLMIWK